VGELTRRENERQDRATEAAIAAARRIVLGDAAVVPMMTPIGRLSDIEWGWIVTAVIFGWVAARAEQATAEGLDTERTIRLTGYDPEPWDAGAVAAILPQLAETPNIDWSKPLEAWSRETVTAFLTRALVLIRKATIARDSNGATITRKTDADLNDSIPL